ncbi:hypothetical protein [Streptomyces sp. NPDC058653]|uniref:hypothetical protein n=1 Tax=Streptomyces sp. NPDC058653 TaxID=3346576 RepID=UPI00366104B9
MQLFVEYDPQPPLGGIDWRSGGSDFFKSPVWAMVEVARADHPAILPRLTT